MSPVDSGFAEAAARRFRVGDRVRRDYGDGHTVEGIVTRVTADMVWVDLDRYGEKVFLDERLELVR